MKMNVKPLDCFDHLKSEQITQIFFYLFHYLLGKVVNSASRGASGALIYTDPAQFAPEGNENTFPRSWWLPDSGIQRGSSMGATGPGDPLTPGFPSIDGIYRQPLNESGVPTIPAFELSYGDAQEIIRRMKGEPRAAFYKFFF